MDKVGILLGQLSWIFLLETSITLDVVNFITYLPQTPTVKF
jgi:hypothetical protein